MDGSLKIAGLVLLLSGALVCAHGLHIVVSQDRSEAEGTEEAGEGILTVATTPDTEVWVDGELVGRTPVLGLELPAGRYDVRLINDSAGIEEERTVTIERGGRSQIVDDLD